MQKQEQEQEPFSLDQCSRPVVVIDLRNNFTATWGQCSFSRCSPLAACPALPPGPYTVHLYSVLTAVPGDNMSVIHKGLTGAHPRSRNTVRAQATTRVPTPTCACIIGPVRINHARREEGEKKEKISEAFSKRVQGGRGEG